MGMMPRRVFRPPLLNYRIRLRNPEDAPTVDRDRYGEIPTDAEEGDWGVLLWAGRRDRRPDQQLEEQGTLIYSQQVIWTIRDRDGVAEDCQVLWNGEIYESEGPPRRVGGVEHGTASRYLEIYTKLRK